MSASSQKAPYGSSGHVTKQKEIENTISQATKYKTIESGPKILTYITSLNCSTQLRFLHAKQLA